MAVERFSWLGTAHGNPAVMDWQELCSIPSRPICPITPVCLLSTSPHTVCKTVCPSLLPLSAHGSLPSSPVPPDSSQPFPPINSRCVSTSRAACIGCEDGGPACSSLLCSMLQDSKVYLLCCFSGILHLEGHQCIPALWKRTGWRQPGGQLSTNFYQAFSQAHDLARQRCVLSKTANFHNAGKRHGQLQGVSTGSFWLQTREAAGTSQPAIVHFSAQAKQCPGLCSLNWQ